MASVVTEQSVAGLSFEGSSSGHQFKSGESFLGWRPSEQVHYATPSTSPYWDSDDEDGGPKLSDLYGNYTWKIDKFSQLNKREHRSDHFEAGGHKWYILIYPHGCDVFHHLSLFLCVANHDKLLPGWSHYAQFTITLVNKDPKKSKDSDTLHRFWKKEHDWGWKKFMEISKVLEEFVDDDTLVIKAKVQVIRKEREDRLFRCLSYEYRRELPRRYLINVEQIFRRFVEEKRGKIWKLIEDKAKWSSFCSFWLAMDQTSRCGMSRVKKDVIHKVLVKNFFIEKDVNSTLVMDSLYTGLKALEGQSTGRKRKSKHIEAEDLLVPMIHLDEDVFVLVDDVLPLLERAAKEPLTPKDEKVLQNRIKDVGAGEESDKDINESDERRLTELGRRTIEIFVLAHVFSKIEVAYQEAVALKKQEELIQEEAALLAAGEQKRRGGADNKKSKKKQGKQKRNSRKGKDKCRDEKSSHHSQGKNGQHSDVVEIKDVPNPEIALEKSDALEYLSDGSDHIDHIGEIIPPESEDTDDSEMHLPTEVSSVQNGIEGRSSSVIGDSSSTCSSDSFTAVVSKKPQNGNSRHKNDGHSASRGKNHRNAVVSDSVDWVDGEANKSFRAVTRDVRNQSETSRVDSLPHSAVSLSKDRIVNGAERHIAQKEEKPDSSPKRVTNFKVSPNPDASRKNPTPKNFVVAAPKSEPKANAVNEISTVEKLSSDSPKQVDTSPGPSNSVQTSPALRQDNQKLAAPEHNEKSVENQARVEKLPTQRVTLMAEQPSTSSVAGLSRPLSAPITSEPRPVASTVPMLQTTHVMSRSVSFAGRFGTEPSVSSAQNYVPQSYRNAIIGGLNSAGLAVNGSLSYSQTPTSLASSPMINPHPLDRIIDHSQSNPSSSFGMINHHHNVLQNAPLWRESTTSDRTRNYIPVDRGSSFSDIQTFDLYNPLATTSEDNPASDLLAGTSGRQSHVVTEEFPHLDIINELLDDDHGIERLSMSGSTNHESFSNGLHYMDSQFMFPGEASSGPGPLLSPSRFQRTRSYHDNDGVWRGYGSSRSLYDLIPQMSPRQHRNRHSIGVLANQWQLNGSDVPPYHQMNADSSSFLTTDYQQLSLGANGYMGFRPSNGL